MKECTIHLSKGDKIMSKKMQLSHSKFCYACGRERRKQDIGYDLRTLKSYCKLACGEGHPNYPLPKIDLVPANEVVFLNALTSKYEGDILEFMKKLLPRAQSFRMTPAIAMHILKYGQEHSTESFNATINAILEEHMLKNSFDQIELKDIPWQKVYRGGYQQTEKAQKVEAYDKMMEMMEVLMKQQASTVEESEIEPIIEEPMSDPEPIVEEVKEEMLQPEPPMEEKPKKKGVFLI